jgi:hypothetical protein
MFHWIATLDKIKTFLLTWGIGHKGKGVLAEQDKGKTCIIKQVNTNHFYDLQNKWHGLYYLGFWRYCLWPSKSSESWLDRNIAWGHR